MNQVDEHGEPWCQRATCDLREEAAHLRNALGVALLALEGMGALPIVLDGILSIAKGRKPGKNG